MSTLYQLYQQAILVNNRYSITSVSGIQDFGTYEYNEDNYNKAITLLNNGDLDKINELTPAASIWGEDITIIQFNDQNGKLYLALIYDSGDLAQNPEVLHIVLL